MTQRSRLVVSIFVALACLPLLRVGIPREIAKFHVAASRNAELAENLREAIREVSRAIEWDPSEPAWRVERAALRLRAEQLEQALQDLRHAEQLPGRPARLDDVYVQALLQAGRPEEALRRWLKAHPATRPQAPPPSPLERLIEPLLSDEAQAARYRVEVERASRQNTLAYFRALAGVELHAALKDAEQAVAFAMDDRLLVDPLGYLMLSAGKSFQGTAASLHAIARLQQAVQRLRRTTHQLQIRATAIRLLQDSAARAEADRRVARAKHMLVQAYVELHEAFAAQGLPREAARRLEWARRIGGDKLRPAEFQWHVGLPEAIARASRLGAFLDTLATVEWKRGQAGPALVHLGQAIELGEAVRQASAWWMELIAREQIDVRQERQQVRELRRSLAIYYNRRSRIREARGDQRGAEADREQVRRLGFQPGNRLL